MSTVPEVAADLGITPKKLRQVLRRLDIKPTAGVVDGAGKAYVLSDEQISEVSRSLSGAPNVDDAVITHDDDPGLPVTLLGTSNREPFEQLRRERSQRLHERLTAAGMSVARMSDERVSIDGVARVLAELARVA